ncbi:MAG: hypothetical protein N2314_05325 [Brevinematales bacterium]|nr:hypothetical protein [Brevinematales bacterium]
MKTRLSPSPPKHTIEEFLKKTKELIKQCQKYKTLTPVLTLSEETRQEIVSTAFLLADEWSDFFLSLILSKKIEDLLTLEDILLESANREVVEAIKNLLEDSLKQKPESNLRLYKLRRIYYSLSTYYSEEDPMIGYEIPLYKPKLSTKWVFSLEDLT